jgi:hypothetical protein
MDQIPGGFWRPVAEGFIQRQIKKPFFGRAYLVFGECFSLWAYMMELGGILATKHAAKPEAFHSAFLGMSGAPGVAKRVMFAQAEEMVAQHPLGSMTFWDYVAADISERIGRTGNDWSSLVMEMGAQKTQPRVALTNSWEYASAGTDLGATHPDVVRAMFERTHKPYSQKEWRTAYVVGLDIGPEPPSTSYPEAEASENKNFMEYCQQFRPDLYAVLKE